MSIQDFRMKIADTAGALMSDDADFSRKISADYDKAKASGHPADFRRVQNAAHEWVQARINKPDGVSPKATAAIEAVQAWSALCGAEVDLKVFAAMNIPGFRGAGGSGWRNAETGQPVRVLAKGEALDTGGGGKVGLGDVLAGILTGTRDPDIKAALGGGTDSAGGFSVPTEVLPQFIDRLRARTRFIEAGARTLMLEGGRVKIMRIETDPTAGWRAENASVAEGDPTFGGITFVPHSLAALVKVSRELLDDSANIAEALEAALVGALSVELDRAALFGTGAANNQPTGLFTVAGNTVSLGENGAAMTSYDPMLDALYELEADNVAAPTAAILHPRTARTVNKLKDTTGQPLMRPAALADLPMLGTTSIPIDQTQGTSSDCSTVFLGDFTRAIMGIRQELVIQRLDQTFAGNLQVGFLAYLRADVGFEQANAFTKIVGIKP
jgi:HK97 family phage major capsid protein